MGSTAEPLNKISSKLKESLYNTSLGFIIFSPFFLHVVNVAAPAIKIPVCETGESAIPHLLNLKKKPSIGGAV